VSNSDCAGGPGSLVVRMISRISPVKSKDNVTEAQSLGQKISLPGCPLLSSRLGRVFGLYDSGRMTRQRRQFHDRSTGE
jgi:hypothetical protein